MERTLQVGTPTTSDNDRCIIIHAGGNKAGSTAIQNMLELNSETIARAGIDYVQSNRVPYTGRMQNGNGVGLVDAIIRGAGSFELKSLIRGCIAENRVAIISSEDFCCLRPPQLEIFFRCLNEMHVKSAILFYVREPAEYFRSGHSQSVRMGSALTLEQYLQEDSRWLHADLLRSVSSVWSPEDIFVLSFEQEKEALFTAFWAKVRDICGIDLRGRFVENAEQTNRSLYIEEMSLLGKLNEVFSVEFAQSISEWLIQDSGYKGTEWKMSQDWIDLIYDRHQNDVAWINTTFFGGRNVLIKPAGPSGDSTIPVAANALPDSSTMIKLLFFALSYGPHMHERQQSRFLHRLSESINNYGSTSTLSNGTQFDNCYYLINNLDLLGTSVDPRAHFEKYGRMEGRRWRVCDCNNCKPRV
jgi:hypothetical protein